MLVKPDPAAFAEGICTLVENHELRLKLGADGKKLIAEKYNYTEFKKKLAACYESLDKRTDS
jgi:glycosyltransferase involved in cell wall biosynthesis